MVGSGGSSARVGLDDRFYAPPAIRKQRELQKQQKLQQQQQKEATTRSRPSLPPAEVRVAEERLEPDDASSKLSVSSSSPFPSPTPTPAPTPPLPLSPLGNLDRLLKSTTPVVPARYFSKANARRRRNGDEVESMPYFCLSDLWESFHQWSAYGAGVPLVLNGTDPVVQYYVPYLSAIQLYVDTTTLRSRPSADGSDGSHYVDTSSDGSSASEDNQIKERISSLGCSSHTVQRECVNDAAEVRPMAAHPVFEYFEKDPPYGREPLCNKISVLASNFPDLNAYKSCDMLSFSWFSVAWYPIYRIPTGPTLKDLDACFLTFHHLTNPKNDARPSTEVDDSCTAKRSAKSSDDRPANLYLPVFGLASYKFRGSLWTLSDPDEGQHASSLSKAADDWLRLRQVEHPDYRFFLSHSNSFRR